MNNPSSPSLLLLGTPIDNVSTQEAVDQIFHWIEEKERSYASFYVSTVNTDFLIHSQGWKWNQVRHPELLQILRTNKMNTADGKPLLWLSDLLGCPLKERVTGADLVPRLLEGCMTKNQSVYLLGGHPSELQKIQEFLKRHYPLLKIAGMEAPVIAVTGEALEIALEEDQRIIQSIQQAKPDLLLIALGNPKQEIWFQRIRHQLHVPVSIGIGGALNLLSGQISRAPPWMQKRGLEWLYRLIQEPKRLWKRYLRDFFNYLYLAIPLLVVHETIKTLTWMRRKLKKKPVTIKKVEMSFSKGNVTILSLPINLDTQEEEELLKDLQPEKAPAWTLLDFQHVWFLSPFHLALLTRAIFAFQQGGKELFFFGMGRLLKCLLRRHRIFDLFEKNLYTQTKQLFPFGELEGEPHFAYTIEKQAGATWITFIGDMDASQNLQKIFDLFSHQSRDSDCHLNLRYCSFIDSSGIGFLLKLRRFQLKQNKQLFLIGLSPTLLQILKIARVDHLLTLST